MEQSSVFFIICMLHSFITLTCGGLIMFYHKEVLAFGHGVETARMLWGSTPHDQLIIEVSNSFSGLLLVLIGGLVFMVGFVRDREFQLFFAKGCVVLHFLMAIWRAFFERRLEDLASDWPRQLVGDLVLALSWVLVFAYTWSDKYD
ncbi:uncharacterized protein LOC127254448 [Andrographis paniculata]|uniref:uncharacterized protein LOC127254448 n=1 Tax=Andrographis paniculata TaxID=175694 RepID=UPI0021E830A4|nr:uncharacterized protein LOC127254448 [Andrographis paniculata]